MLNQNSSENRDLCMTDTSRRRRKNLTAEEKTKIAYLRTKGWGLERLAAEFKCTVGSVGWCCLMAGVTSPGFERRAPAKKLPATYKRNGKVVRRYTPKEDETIESMREAGKTLSEISKATGRRHNSIIGRLATLAMKQEMSA